MGFGAKLSQFQYFLHIIPCCTTEITAMTTVLIVEDTMTEAAIISGTLKAAGFDIMQAISSEDAKVQVSQRKPDLIVLDVVLPGESGFELCRELKDKPETNGIPVVMCSTKDSEMDKFWGMKQGAAAYLRKPIVADELVRTVKLLTQG
jgi:two-component system, chemotaxis family, response regulator PixH